MDTSLVFIFLEVLAIATLKDNPINEQIRCKEMMVIGPNGEQLGVKSKQDALTLAGYAGFDLVLMSDSGNMPVCKIMDYNKFKYEKKKKTKEAQKKQREAMVETKEFRLSVNIDIHDFNTRVKNAKKAFEKAQAVNAEKKLAAILDSCSTKIHIAAAAAGTAGASPIPGSDAPIIAAIQSTLIYTINSEFELDEDIKQSAAIATGILGVTALAQVGKAVVSNLLKFIPGAGTLVGGAISATTAIALTEAVGHAYVKTLSSFYNKQEAKVILPENTKKIIETFTQIFGTFKKTA